MTEKYHKMKLAYTRACDFLKAIVCDFAKIDVEIHLVPAEKLNFPPFEYDLKFTKGIHNLSLGATNFPKLVIVFKISRDSEKFFIPSTMLVLKETTSRHYLLC